MKNELVDLGNVERIINLVADVSAAENINLLEIMEACSALRASCAALIDKHVNELKENGSPFFGQVTESNSDEEN